MLLRKNRQFLLLQYLLCVAIVQTFYPLNNIPKYVFNSFLGNNYAIGGKMEETELWLRKSERDMLAAEVNFKQGLFEESAFFSHQAAEKALKALYIKKFKRLWKVHDLRALAQGWEQTIPF